VQIVQLQGAEHFVDDCVLMDKLGQFIHDGCNQRSRVTKANIDVSTRNHSMVRIHAHMESNQGARFTDLMNPMLVIGLLARSDVKLLFVHMLVFHFLNMNFLCIF